MVVDLKNDRARLHTLAGGNSSPTPIPAAGQQAGPGSGGHFPHQYTYTDNLLLEKEIRQYDPGAREAYETS